MKDYYKYLSDACHFLDKNKRKYEGAIGRFFYIIGSSSYNLLNFFTNFKNKNYFIFKNEEELILAKAFIHVMNIKKKRNILLNKTLLSASEIKKIRLLKFIYYLGRNLFFNTFVSKKVKKIDYLFFWDKYKYISLFRLLFSQLKNSYLLLHDNNFFPGKFLKKTIKISCLEKLNIGYKEDFEYNYSVLKKTLLFYNPKVVIFAEGDDPVHSILSLVCKDLKIKSLCLQWGSSPRKSIKYGFRDFTCDYVLVHGKFFFDLIKKYTKKSIIKITGNPLVSNNKFIFKKKAIILLQPQSILTKNPQNLDLFFYFISNVIRSNNDWEFVVRPHPDHDHYRNLKKFNKFSNCKIIYSRNISLKESLTNCSVAFSIFSSSLMDALTQKIIPFSFDTTGLLGGFHPDLNKFKIGISTDNIKDAILKANNLLRNKKLILEYCKNIKNYKFNINYKYGKQAINEICKYIRN